MPFAHPPKMTVTEMTHRQDAVLQNFKDPIDHLSAVIFPSGLDAPEIATVPYRDGVVHLDYWLYNLAHLNYYVNSTDTSLVGIQRVTFKRFPTSRGLPFAHAYTIFYWAQDLKMPLNQALLKYCVGAAENRLLRGNVMVLKHRQSSGHKFVDVTTKDMALIGSILGSAIGGKVLDCADEYDMGLEVIEL